MPQPGIALEQGAVFVRGAFTPAMFSPLWFRDLDLVGSIELRDQHIDVISQDLALFKLGWLQVNVSAEALQLSTDQPEELPRLRDVALGVLRTLDYVPVAALGINRTFHVAVDSKQAWHAVGDTLVPKAHWEDVLRSPGMRNVALWGVRPDGYSGRVQVQVEPSNAVPQAVYVSVNDHFNLTYVDDEISDRNDIWDTREETLQESVEKNRLARDVIMDEWDASLSRAESYWHRALATDRGSA